MKLYTSSLNTLKRFKEDQRGAFAITFVLLAGFLFGLTALGLEGSRYVMERARLSDAMEQAALALSAEDNGAGAERNYTLAEDYFRAYMLNAKTIFRPSIKVSSGVSRQNLSYVEYRVSGQTLHNSWISSSLFPSFPEQQKVGDNGAARKFRSSIDVMFVTDFSGSMNEPFAGYSTKLVELKRIVLKLARELYRYDAGNQTGFIPFGWGGKKNNRCDFPFVFHTPLPPLFLNNHIPWQIEYYIDIAATIAAIPNEVNPLGIPLSQVSQEVCLKNSVNWQIPLTSDIAILNQIQGMSAFGGTLVSSGVLLGAKELAKGKSARKILVIVSDGIDDPPEIKVTSKLIDAGMCDRIREVISTSESVGKIAFIGIGYKPAVRWRRCVGDKNFYISNTISTFEQYLQRAVFEEVGHNTTKE